jgi:hypothetical protein
MTHAHTSPVAACSAKICLTAAARFLARPQLLTRFSYPPRESGIPPFSAIALPS